MRGAEAVPRRLLAHSLLDDAEPEREQDSATSTNCVTGFPFCDESSKARIRRATLSGHTVGVTGCRQVTGHVVVIADGRGHCGGQTGRAAHREVEGVEDARNAVLESADHGVSFIRIYPDLGRDEVFEIARMADSLGLPVSGHVPYAVSPSEAATAGMDSFEHGLRLAEFCVRKPGPADAGIEQWALPDRLRSLGDPRACLDTFTTMASRNAYLVPTLAAMQSMTPQGHSPPEDPRR